MGSASYLYIKPVLSGDDGGASETAYIKVYRNSVLIADEVDNMCIVVMTGDFIDIDAYLGVVGDDNYGRQMQLDIQLLDNRKMADICGDSLQAGPDGNVDFFDFAALAARWFDENCTLPDFCSGADLNIDSVVDIFDLSILAGDWLKGIVYIAPPPTPFYEQNLDTNPGWTTEGLWSWGVPTGEGGSYGSPDPTSGYTGDNVYGYNLSGDYTDNLPATHLTSTAIDCTGRQNVHLLFWRWLGVESPDYDKASVAVSNDGVNWVTVWQNPNTETADSAWTAMEIDISAVADGRPTVYLRWTMGSTDSSVVYCGWNIDDIQLYEKP